MKVVLEIVEGPHQGVRLEFAKPETLLVGRGATAQLQLTEDPHFSRNHFTLDFDPPACRLRAVACWLGQLDQFPIPSAALLGAPWTSSEQPRGSLGAWSSPMACAAVMLAPTWPMAHVPRRSDPLVPMRRWLIMIVLEVPSAELSPCRVLP